VVLAGLRMPAPGDPHTDVLTVGDWLAHWLVSRTSPATSTMRSYSAHVRLYLAPYLGPVLLGELSAAHVQAMFTAIIRHHQAPGTRFLTASASHRLYAVYHLIALRGLRRGEAAGLRWCDVDLDARTAMISQQLQQHGGRVEITPPKTPYSARVIALDHTTVAALRAHQRRQRAEAASYGPGYQASGYVFTNRAGGPMLPDRLTRIFRQLAEQAGLPPIRLHDCATAPPPSPWPPAWTCAPCRRCSATPASCSPPTPTFPSCQNSPSTPRRGSPR
jgi:integrase